LKAPDLTPSLRHLLLGLSEGVNSNLFRKNSRIGIEMVFKTTVAKVAPTNSRRGNSSKPYIMSRSSIAFSSSKCFLLRYSTMAPPYTTLPREEGALEEDLPPLSPAINLKGTLQGDYSFKTSTIFTSIMKVSRASRSDGS
jgi:uncharacterized membrane protein (UPF0136 family)